MRRAAIIAALCLFAASARAAPFFPCPRLTFGWSVPGQAPISSILYDQNKQILSVVFNNTFASVYSNVPLSVMQTFSRSKNLLQTYQLIVVPVYHALLLEEQYNCPILQEAGGYIWTN